MPVVERGKAFVGFVKIMDIFLASWTVERIIVLLLFTIYSVVNSSFD